ncbi:MAG TPA: hypothetical protein VFJ09_05765 [Nocardioidaceae bacterium]|nr:hypothetical protein [Nocardioidaceae bacterium]
MTDTSPSEPTGTVAAVAAAARRDCYRVRYEGPLELLGAVTKTFRDAGVTLASVCVDGSPTSGDPDPAAGDGRAALALICQGRFQSVVALVDCFTREFAPRAELTVSE